MSSQRSEDSKQMWWRTEQGEVIGPVSLDVVRSMHRHQKLQLFWELSTDRETWVLVEEHPALVGLDQGNQSATPDAQQEINIGNIRKPKPVPPRRRASTLSSKTAAKGCSIVGKIFMVLGVLFVLIILGVLALKFYNDYKQKKMIQDYRDSFKDIERWD